jgi:hypothetical protein
MALVSDLVSVDVHPHDCTKDSGCTLAINSRKNEKTIISNLAAGDFSLVLYDALGDRNRTIAPCSQFSLSFVIEAFDESENLVNCLGMFQTYKIDTTQRAIVY